MPMIEIPDAYWTISPRGFTALIGDAQPAIEALYGGLGGDVNDLQSVNDNDLAPQLGDLDGDAYVVDAAVASEFQAAAATPIGSVIAQYPSADGLHLQGDTDVAPVNAVGT